MLAKIQDKTRYTLFPFFAITTLPILLFFLIQHLSPVKEIHFTNYLSILKYIGIFSLIAYILQFPYVKSMITHGPLQVEGTLPEYTKNGFAVYLITVTSQLIYTYYYGNGIFLFLMDNHLLSLIVLSVIGFIFTIGLFIQGKIRHQNLMKKDKLHKNLQEPPLSNWLFQYYRGMDFHPKLLGVDVKQFTNCRFGLMIWQVLVLGWALASYERFGFNFGVFSTTLLQTLYLAKFYYWETGYFYTLDMILDRAGFYICWGCIVFVPTFYTLHSFIMCTNPPNISTFEAVFYTSLGLLSLGFNYWVDEQKQHFQQCNKKGKECYIWGQKAKFMNVKYEKEGKMVDSKLLLAGFWGITRHMNYTFELLLAFSWCVTGIHSSIFSLSYFLFLFALLISRAYRDETKCSAKYGKYWDEYCQQVKYRLIPYVY